MSGRSAKKLIWKRSSIRLLMNPNASLIKGLIRVEEIEDPLMQKIRYMDKLIDELAKGKKMEKIFTMVAQMSACV